MKEQPGVPQREVALHGLTRVAGKIAVLHRHSLHSDHESPMVSRNEDALSLAKITAGIGEIVQGNIEALTTQEKAPARGGTIFMQFSRLFSR